MPRDNGTLTPEEEDQMDRDLAAREAAQFVTDESGNIVDAVDIKPEIKPHAAWSDFTVRGNGERIVDEHGEDLRYAPGEGWFEWDGTRWARDVEQQRSRLRANNTLTKMLLTSCGLKGRELKHVMQSQAPAGWASALAAASVYAPIATTHEAFDDGPHAPAGHEDRLNVANGTIILSTGELRDHERADMITKVTPTIFVPDVVSDMWSQFLIAVQPDPLVRAFLQRLCGYWLCGHVRDEIFPIFWGTGGNGKGTYLDTVRHVLGEYGAMIPEDVIMVSRGAQPHPTSKMVFRGLRLGIASETEEGAPLALSTLKRLTGGDVITARRMGKDFISWEPTHKIVLQTNARPRLQGTVSAALKRRIYFVSWNTQIGREAADRSLKARLAAPVEQSGVLNWALEGYREYLRIGLQPPPTVTDSTSEYLASEDTLGSFVEDRLVFGEGKEIHADHLYKAYREYCRDSGELQAVRPQDFKPAFLANDAAVKAGVEWKRTREARVYRNMELRGRSKEDHETADQRRSWQRN